MESPVLELPRGDILVRIDQGARRRRDASPIRATLPTFLRSLHCWPTTAPRLTAPEVERLLIEVRTLTAAFKAGGHDAFEADRSHG